MSDNDPVAWMVARNGEPCHVAWTLDDAKKERNRLEIVSTGTPSIELFSLYRSPALTDAEREAIEFFAAIHNEGYGLFSAHTDTLRNLLERTK